MATHFKLAGLTVVALIWVSANGCSGRANSPFNGLSPAQSHLLSVQLNQTRDQALREDIASAFADRRPANILLLSGGDADGAFGCGVLSGWRKSVSSPRPNFDIVTGVSTGALIATFAFLGEERDDALLKSLYTQIHDSDVFVGPFTWGEPNSVFDTKPLERLIEKYVTEDVISRVAAAHRSGRRLYVTTVEMETGHAVVWPMSRIATEPNGASRFRKILLAAAAIPVLFPPVQIDGGLHVDAGLREAISLRKIMLATDKSAAPASARRASPTVWAIVNGRLHGEPEVVHNDLLSIGARSLALYTESLQLYSLRDAAHIAATASKPYAFRWIAEPENEPTPSAGALGPMFDPKVTSALFIKGEAMMRKSGTWNEGPPALEGDPK